MDHDADDDVPTRCAWCAQEIKPDAPGASDTYCSRRCKHEHSRSEGSATSVVELGVDPNRDGAHPRAAAAVPAPKPPPLGPPKARSHAGVPDGTPPSSPGAVGQAGTPSNGRQGAAGKRDVSTASGLLIALAAFGAVAAAGLGFLVLEPDVARALRDAGSDLQSRATPRAVFAASPYAVNSDCATLLNHCVRVQCYIANSGDAGGVANVTFALDRGRGMVVYKSQRVPIDAGSSTYAYVDFVEAKITDSQAKAFCSAD